MKPKPRSDWTFFTVPLVDIACLLPSRTLLNDARSVREGGTKHERVPTMWAGHHQCNHLGVVESAGRSAALFGEAHEGGLDPSVGVRRRGARGAARARASTSTARGSIPEPPQATSRIALTSWLMSDTRSL